MTDRAEPSAVIDLRTYKLKCGAGTTFGRILQNDALPMLDRFGIDVVAHGSSLDDHDLYHLLRCFPSEAERNERLEAFYGSREWEDRYRDDVVALIESYHMLLIPNTIAVPPAG